MRASFRMKVRLIGDNVISQYLVNLVGSEISGQQDFFYFRPEDKNLKREVARFKAVEFGSGLADVIKLEHPVRGEPARGITLLRERYTGGFLEVLEVCNRNKRSVGIDLQSPLGKEVVHKLIKTADVFITNFQEKTLVKMELDYDTLSRLNPRLVYGIGTGWGRKGSDKGRPAFDLAAVGTPPDSLRC